jgi:hypothetical protein
MLLCLFLKKLLGQSGLFNFERVLSPSIPSTGYRDALSVIGNKHQHASAGIKLLACLTPCVEALRLLHISHSGDKVGHHSLTEALHLCNNLLFAALIVFDLLPNTADFHGLSFLPTLKFTNLCLMLF